MSNLYRNNVYWSGTFQAHLLPSQISVPWGTTGSQPNSKSVDFVNRAFEIYYLAKTNISGVSNHDHKQAMSLQLLEAARSGFGFGVSDLEEAFIHIVANSGTWVDDDNGLYNGGRDKAFAGGLVRGPTSIVNFMNSIDGKMTDLKDCIQDFGAKKQSLLDSYSQIGRQNAGQTSAEPWTKFGEMLGEFKWWGERAEPFLWLAPAQQSVLGGAVGFVDVISNIHSSFTTYNNCLRGGVPTDTAIALAAARAAMAWVPVLGGFYGRAIDMIPGMKVWFEHVMVNYQQRIERETGMSTPRL